MRTALKWLGSMALWCGLAAFAGAQIGYRDGYAHGVRDIGRLVIKLHEAGEAPTAPAARDALWGRL
ncbi:hypothetical protein [Bradyrhizobium sp. sGM-13]|uniref:hypothetical protein n=1 Tax=Bradyrhizobium sp. sGM-13 TaxID=2831781 RepID=UPI001BCDF729|nr:hypothetical protein [Bradyrhizobium sp. sGM-13]